MKSTIFRIILAILIITWVMAAVSCGTSSPTTTPAQPGTGTQVKPPPGETPGLEFNPVAVAVENFAFSPATITIAVGTTVTWTNKDDVRHTVTSRTQLFDSGLLAKDSSFSYKFDQKGSYEYYCIPHPYMVGKVIVE